MPHTYSVALSALSLSVTRNAVYFFVVVGVNENVEQLKISPLANVTTSIQFRLSIPFVGRSHAVACVR